MIHLTCPKCQSALKIDPGFAGGICRCFHCGTMMTVPNKKQHGQATNATRPERPESPISKEDTAVGLSVSDTGELVEMGKIELDQVPVAQKSHIKTIAIMMVIFLVVLLLAAGIFGEQLLALLNQYMG